MAMYGPIPKRDSERVRRNKPDVPTEVVTLPGVVEVPDLDIPDAHPMIVDFYASLSESGQSMYYEPSDWQFARLTMVFLDGLLKSSRVNGNILQVVNSMLSNLLVTEGERRRVRMEVERGQTESTVYHAEDYFRQRLSQPAA